MSKAYQNLSEYHGSLYGTPQYNGIEYDWSVPDNLTIGSPGGVYSVPHHWTKGFYGRGDTSGDIYAGEQERYISGNYGNLYQTGHTASQEMGYFSEAPDYKYWDNMKPLSYQMNETPGYLPYPGPEPEHPSPFESSNLKKKDVEMFTPENDGIEMIEPPDQNESENGEFVLRSSVSPWILFILFLLAFICFDFWATAGHAFIREKILKGSEPSWIQISLFALFITISFLIIIYIFDVPLTRFETL